VATDLRFFAIEGALRSWWCVLFGAVCVERERETERKKKRKKGRERDMI